MKLEGLTIKNILKGLSEKEFSCEDLTCAYLDRIKKLEPNLNAFITVTDRQALAQAQTVDKLIVKEGKRAFEKYPLLGVPYAAKDLFSTKGIETTAGSNILKGYIPEYESTVTQKLKDAGAILLGKTNLDAFAHGSSTENSDFFTTKNPWDLTRLPGGSSGGSAAATAAAEVPFAIGTETGGSIRQPAAWCGVTGIKPTYGKVSRYGVIAMASSLDSPGVMAKTVGDCEAVLKIISGKDSLDATSSATVNPSDIAPPAAGLKRGGHGRLQIGIIADYLRAGVTKEVLGRFEEAVLVLKKLGFDVGEISLLDPQYSVAVYTILQRAEVSSNLSRYDGIRFGQKRDSFGAEAKRRIMLGTYVLSAGYYDAYYEKAQKVRTLIVDDFKKAFQKFNILIAPTTPVTALKIGAGEDQAMFGELMDILVEPSTIAGLPGLSIPCGFDSKGLPVGMQLIGPQFGEDLLFEVGRKYQEATDWHKYGII